MNDKTEPHTIKGDNFEAVFNGGAPLKGCPPDNATGWEWAKKWEDAANYETDGEGPQWSFDCGFKLSFDGPAVQVSGRFYPPKAQYGPGWDGSVNLHVGGLIAHSKEFQVDTIEDLKSDVETHVRDLLARVTEIMSDAVNSGRFEGL